MKYRNEGEVDRGLLVAFIVPADCCELFTRCSFHALAVRSRRNLWHCVWFFGVLISIARLNPLVDFNFLDLISPRSAASQKGI